MRDEQVTVRLKNVIWRIVVCAAVLGLGLLGMRTLASMRTPPKETQPEERVLKVEAVRVMPEDVPVFMTGYGDVQPLDEVTIAPEVSGRIVSVHPRLEVGEVVPEGEILFAVDPRNYEAAVLEARANVSQLETSIARLEKQLSLDRARLKTLERSRELARAEYERQLRLFQEHKVTARSRVDSAESAYNAASDQADQMAQMIALYPLQIRETRSRLDAARAGLDLARANLDRCTVRAPFKGRIKAASVETGQFISPGQNVLTLANDSTLEIRVSLDSRDARRWLLFQGPSEANDLAWFGGLADKTVRIQWTEDVENHVWQGSLHRVVEFDRRTRTLTVAIRIPAEKALSRGNGDLPLVEGMFCKVDIPGKTLQDVMRLPRWAVSMNGTVYVAKDGRLRTVDVTLARIQGDEALVSKGLEPGDLVITTRLTDPLENSLLEITNLEPPEEGGAS
jgi:RND family efflux transporter MFP subunit